jgi:hypothetical protein
MKEKYKMKNVICTTKLDNFLDNSLFHTHIMRESKKSNVSMRERELYKKLSNIIVQITLLI